MLWRWERENQPQSDTACWTLWCCTNSMIRFVHKIDSICDVTKRSGTLVKGHLFRRSVREANVGDYCFVLESSIKISPESEKKPIRPKQSLKQLHL